MDDYKFDFAKEKRRLWAEVEKEYGLLSRAFRARMEEDAWDRVVSDEENVGILGDVIHSFMEVVSLLDLPIAAKTEAPSAPIRGHYRKSFERRLYLLRFVVKAKGNLEARADWPKITEEWNTANPSDVITPLTLKREYHMAKNDKQVLHNFYFETIREIIQQVLKQIRLESDYFKHDGNTFLERVVTLLHSHPRLRGIPWQEMMKLEAPQIPRFDVTIGKELLSKYNIGITDHHESTQ